MTTISGDLKLRIRAGERPTLLKGTVFTWSFPTHKSLLDTLRTWRALSEYLWNDTVLCRLRGTCIDLASFSENR